MKTKGLESVCQFGIMLTGLILSGNRWFCQGSACFAIWADFHFGWQVHFGHMFPGPLTTMIKYTKGRRWVTYLLQQKLYERNITTIVYSIIVRNLSCVYRIFLIFLDENTRVTTMYGTCRHNGGTWQLRKKVINLPTTTTIALIGWCI